MRNDDVESSSGAGSNSGAEGSNAPGVIDQVRELLFGEAKRSTDKDLAALDAKLESRLDALTASMNARLSDLETLVLHVQSEAESAQARVIDDIGSAISRLGADIRAMSGARAPK